MRMGKKDLNNLDIIVFFEKLKNKYGDSIALADRRHVSITYKELYEMIWGCARHYMELEDERIVAVVSNSIEAYINMLGAICSGKIVIIVDPFTPVDDMLKVIEAAGVNRIIISSKEKSVIHRLKENDLEVELFSDIFEKENINQQKLPICKGKFVFFTSGTTNKSKGVVLDAGKVIMNAIALCDFGDVETDKWIYIPVPVAHLYGILMSFSYLSIGKKIFIGDTKRLRKELDSLDCQVLVATPSIAGMIFSKGWNMKNVSRIVVAGSKCDMAIEKKACERNIFLQNFYGSTEIGGVAINSIGHSINELSLIKNVSMFIVDGETRIDSAYRMLGYLDNADAVFTLEDSIAVNDNGTYCIEGRRSDFIVLDNGMKLDVASLENRIRNSKECILDVCIIYINKHLYAYIYTNKDYTIIKEEIASINASLPYYQKIYEVILSDKPLPRTTLGKLKRKEIEGWVKQK